YPRERLGFMLEDAGAAVVLTHSALVGRLPDHGARTVRLDAEWPAIARMPATAPADLVSPHNTAYVIYTSGSTGTPKGVTGTHAGMANRIAAQAGIRAFVGDEVCCQKTSIGFVDSVFETVGPLCAGKPLVVVPDAGSDAEKLTSIIEHSQVTRLL